MIHHQPRNNLRPPKPTRLILPSNPPDSPRRPASPCATPTPPRPDQADSHSALSLPPPYLREIVPLCPTDFASFSAVAPADASDWTDRSSCGDASWLQSSFSSLFLSLLPFFQTLPSSLPSIHQPLIPSSPPTPLNNHHNGRPSRLRFPPGYPDGHQGRSPCRPRSSGRLHAQLLR
jgi:hypothetical protein